MAGTGDVHAAPSADWIGFLTVTKYPPSVAFLLLTLGLNLILLRAFVAIGTEPRALCRPLDVFGRTELFFYVSHLWLLGMGGLAFRQGAGLIGLYSVWALALVVLLFACQAWDKFKRSTPVELVWRMF